MAVSVKEVQQVKAFQQFSDAQIALLASLLIRRRYTPDELIFLEGDTSTGLWFILSGHVRIIKISLEGRVQALCVMNSGKCFGGCPIFSTAQNPANAQAVDDVTLLVLPHEETANLKARNPEFMTTLLQIYSERLSLLARLGESLGTWSVKKRIDDTLLTYAVAQEEKLVVNFTHEKIADLAGTVREVVTRHLASLERKQIIVQSSGAIEIRNQTELQSACLIGSVT